MATFKVNINVNVDVIADTEQEAFISAVEELRRGDNNENIKIQVTQVISSNDFLSELDNNDENDYIPN